MTLRYWAAYSAYASSALAVAQLVNSAVPSPYMDELFHIPQAQAYCRGDFGTWDPLLTTPPALYVLSSLFSRISCRPPALRLLNTLFLLLLPPLYSILFRLIRHPVLRPSTKGKVTPSKLAKEEVERGEEGDEGIVLACFPVVAFFGWLYYTDLGSLVGVLLSLAMSLKGRWGLSALAGAAACWFRQTNIIWLAFVAATAVVRSLQSQSELYDPSLSKATLRDVPISIYSLALHSLRNVPLLAPLFAAYLPVFIAAGAFVHWNGGIVLGDKLNHVPTFHLSQLYYFTAFSAVFLAPVTLSPRVVKTSILSLVGSPSRILLTLLTLAGMCWTISQFTIAHPFLLADNRHYAFYVWRRIINPHPLARYFLTPLYLFASRILLSSLASSQTLTLLPALLSLLSLALTLIPSPLIEPRYFLIPYVLLRLHLRVPGGTKERRWRLGLEGLLYLAVLGGTVGVFVGRGFEWEGRDDVMRFMW